jgi:hypothetical protein
MSLMVPRARARKDEAVYVVGGYKAHGARYPDTLTGISKSLYN